MRRRPRRRNDRSRLFEAHSMTNAWEPCCRHVCDAQPDRVHRHRIKAERRGAWLRYL
jgi:hypothetical protein